MATKENKAIEISIADDFLIEAAKLAQELVTLRNQLASARRRHSELLAQREPALCEGIDVLPQVRELFLAIDELPGKIDRLEQGVRRIVTEGVEALNAANNERASAAYQVGRDKLRESLRRFREALGDIWEF